MAYGLRCFSQSGYLVFDSSIMPNYLKVCASGSITLNGGATSGVISAPDLSYVYVYFSSPVLSINSSNSDRYEVVSQTSSSFKVKNTSNNGQTFNYVALVR